MYYEPLWKKSEYNSGNLKSLDFDYESNLLNIIEYQGSRKECLKQVPIDKVTEIKFVIHHSTGRGRSVVYLQIIYQKNVRNGCITVYLPWRYDRKMIEELQEIAKKYSIPFSVEKNTGTLLGMIIILIIIVLISILSGKNT